MRNQFVGAAVSAMLPLLFSQAAFAAPARSAAPEGQDLSLFVTLGTDLSEGACGTDTSLQVTVGDQVNVCYVVTNDWTGELNFHTLTDDVAGPIFIDAPASIAPGASYQYNRVVTAMDSSSPTSTWTAYDVHPDYVYSTGAVDPDVVFANGFDGAAAQYAFVDITATGTNLLINDDDYVIAGIGFPFTFYGRTADQITVSNNGGLLFDQAAGTRGRIDYLPPTNRTLPDRMVGPAILPFWDDLQQDYIDGIGNVFVQTLGDAPNRRFVIEWYNLPVSFGGGGETVTFEAILSEGSNDILFQYADVECGSSHCDGGASATIGLNSDRTHAILYSFDELSISDGTAILFTPTQPVALQATAQSTLDVGAPVITADPTSFDKTIAAGATTTDTLTIGNTGNRVLTWNIGAVGARSHFPPTPRFALPMGDPSKTSIGPAPLPRATKTHALNPLAAAGIPAFAADLINSQLVGLDVTAPGTLTSEVPLPSLSLLAGDFKGEDFNTLYAIDFLSFDLFKVDVATGAVTLVYLAVPPPGVSADAWTGMGWDATTSTMYAVTSGGRTSVSTLVKIDPDTADITLVGTITGVGDPNNGTAIIDVAIDANGLMYGIDIVTDTLVAIDKTTGEASTIGSLGFDANYAEGLDFDDTTNTLYFAAFNNDIGMAQMYTIDTSTGLGTPIGPIGPDPSNTQYSALGIARLVGICSYPADVPWLAFSDTRGSTQPGETTPITVTFDATALTAGSYSADICVNNNDLTNKRLAVPVSLTVQ